MRARAGCPPGSILRGVADGPAGAEGPELAPPLTGARTESLTGLQRRVNGWAWRLP